MTTTEQPQKKRNFFARLWTGFVWIVVILAMVYALDWFLSGGKVS